MPRPFAITAVSNSVFLDDQRKGEARFTVSNQSGRSIEGRARLVTEEAEPWVTLRGSAHREFATAGTEQYTVEIEVPPEAPSGSYTVRLDMVGEERPDEQYVEGPTVTFEVPEPEPAPEPFPWKVVAAVAVVLLIGGGALACQLFDCQLFSDTVVVPDVSELTLNQALATLQEEDLFGRDSTAFSDTVAEGLIIRTEPPAGRAVERKSEVILFRSAGTEREVAFGQAEQRSREWIEAFNQRDMERLLSLASPPFFFPEGPVMSTREEISASLPERLNNAGWFTDGEEVEVTHIDVMTVADLAAKFGSRWQDDSTMQQILEDLHVEEEDVGVWVRHTCCVIEGDLLVILFRREGTDVEMALVLSD